MPRPCALYARFSSDRQNPKSCDDQLKEAQTYAEAQGWRVIGKWHDDGISGTKGRSARGGWDQMLEFIEDGRLAGGVVLTWDIDRWSRDWADGMIEALRLHKLGVDLADTKDGLLEQHGLAGKILLTLKVAGADEFIQKLRRNVKRGLAAKREHGYYTCPPPFGFNTERTPRGSVLVPHQDQAPQVVRIYQMIDQGKTPAAVARQLNTEGITTKRGSKWTPSTIRGIVRSPVNIGKIAIYNTRAGGTQVSRCQVPADQVQILEGKHDAIIPLDLFDRAQACLKARHRGPNSKRSYPISGLVICGECGRTCQVTGGEWPYRNYRCRPYGVTTECTSRRIVRVELLEDAVKTWALAMSKDTDAIEIAALRLAEAEWKEAKRQSEDRAPIEQEIRNLEHKQSRLLEALYEGNAPALINERLRQIQIDLDEAEARLEQIGNSTEPVPAADLAQGIVGALAAGAVDLLKLRTLIGRIELPADPDAAPRLEGFGEVFELDIPPTSHDRTRWAASRQTLS